MKNIDKKTVFDFGSEWNKFDQNNMNKEELRLMFNSYFSIFPWNKINNSHVGFDLGCGSGRWAKIISNKVKTLYCIEPSSAIDIAKDNLKENKNCIFLRESDSNMSIKDNSMDFGYSLGVLHHIPDINVALKNAVLKLKKNAPLLVYIYYAFDNRSRLYNFTWKISNFIRKIISKLPFKIKSFICDLIAFFIYLPLAKIALIFERFGLKIDNFLLSYYRDKSFYTMRTDALDRFGTKLENRFTKKEIKTLLHNAGLDNIEFSEDAPYWCAIGFKF